MGASRPYRYQGEFAVNIRNILAVAAIATSMAIPLSANAQRWDDSRRSNDSQRGRNDRRQNDSRQNQADRRRNDTSQGQNDRGRYNQQRQSDQRQRDDQRRYDQQRQSGQRQRDDQRRYDQQRQADQRRRDDSWNRDNSRRRSDDRQWVDRGRNYRSDNRYYDGFSSGRRNDWRDIAIGFGAIGIIGLLEHDDCLVFSGATGALYSLWRYNEDIDCDDPYRRARAHYFSLPYFYRDGCRYERRIVTRDGERCYEFARCD